MRFKGSPFTVQGWRIESISVQRFSVPRSELKDWSPSLNPEPLNPEPWTHEVQWFSVPRSELKDWSPSLNPEPLNPEPRTQNPERRTLNLEPNKQPLVTKAKRMPIHHFIFYIFISVSYIDTAGKTIRNASNLTVVAVKFRGETTPTSAVFQRFILIGRDKNPPNPLSQRGDLAWFDDSNWGGNEQCQRVYVPPFKKGGSGGIFYWRTFLPIGTYLYSNWSVPGSGFKVVKSYSAATKGL